MDKPEKFYHEYEDYEKLTQMSDVYENEGTDANRPEGVSVRKFLEMCGCTEEQIESVVGDEE